MEPFDYESELERCGRRDASALRRLYDREAGFLLGVALRIVRRREVAADVIHDAFLDVWQRAGQFDRSRGAGRVWLASIVRYRALKHVRQAGREADYDRAAHEAVTTDAPDPMEALAASQEAEALRRCLGDLPEERRRVILLAYVEGLSQSEIAMRLDAPIGTVKAWTRRSLLALKDCLS